MAIKIENETLCSDGINSSEVSGNRVQLILEFSQNNI